MTDDEMVRAATDAALDSVRRLWQGPAANINPRSTLASLSEAELGWIVNMAISEWIIARSKQTSTVRGCERLIHSFEGNPDPWEKGAVLAALPTLADVVSDLGATEKPIGSWSRDDVCFFVWSAYRAIDAMRVQRDEIPTDLDIDTSQAELLEAG